MVIQKLASLYRHNGDVFIYCQFQVLYWVAVDGKLISGPGNLPSHRSFEKDDSKCSFNVRFRSSDLNAKDLS